MFGGVDIFGSKKKEKVDQEPSHAQDLTGSTEAPPTQPKPAAKPGRTLSSGSGGLFGEGPGGEEKDDDDIFSFQTASRKHKYVELVILVF